MARKNQPVFACPFCEGDGELDELIHSACLDCCHFLYTRGTGYCFADEDGPQPVNEMEDCPHWDEEDTDIDED